MRLFRALLFFFIFSPLFMLSQSLVSPKPFGSFIDINGYHLSNYVTYDYLPTKYLKVIERTNSEKNNKESVKAKGFPSKLNYYPGYYIIANNEKINGYINYSSSQPEYIQFIPAPKEKPIKVYPYQCEQFVIPSDTFDVVTVEVRESSTDDYEPIETTFLHREANVAGILFYKHLPSGKLYYKSDSAIYGLELKKRKSIYIKALTDLFSDDTLLVNKIIRKNEGYSNTYAHYSLTTLNEAKLVYSGEPYKKIIEYGVFDQMIKTVQHLDTWKKRDTIFINVYFEETDQQEDAAYYAFIDSVTENYWYYSYYSFDHQLIFKARYSDIFPHIKDGEFTWYHSNGNVCKKMVFNDDQIIGNLVRDFYSSGSLHYMYASTENGLYFDYVMDSLDNNILDENGNGTEVFYDPYLNKVLNRHYKQHLMVSSFYIHNGEKIYQYCEINAKLRKWKTMKYYFREKLAFPPECIEEKEQGVVFIKQIIHPDGKVVNTEILNCESEKLKDFILYNVTDPLFTDSWKAAKNMGKAVTQEVVFPLVIMIFDPLPQKATYFTDDLMMPMMPMITNPGINH